ncbi:MAG: CvpA family protein, partial [Clostridium sp.]|nr:CvpA family protein [Clostridium sp.]
MNQNKSSRRFHLPKSLFGRTILSLAITLIIGAIFFYVTLPALNFHAKEFYSFLLLLCLIYTVCVFLLSGGLQNDDVVRTNKEKLGDWLRFIKSRCLPVGILIVVLLSVSLIGQVISLPIFRAGSYRDLLTVETGDFAADVAQISFDKIPTLDRSSAEFLGDRQMGTLSDMVSQFEYSNDSTQINYQGRPVRVAPIDYADLFKWLTNRGGGLPAYVVVDMVTQ